MRIELPTSTFVLVLLSASACSHPPSVRPRVSCEYVRIDPRDANAPAAFVTRLKRAVARELIESGTLAAGYPVPCRWEKATGRVTYCLPDASASLDDTESLLLDEAGYALTFRIIDFPSPMAYTAQVYLLADGPDRDLRGPDRGASVRRVQIIGGSCDESLHSAILATGALPFDD